MNKMQYKDKVHKKCMQILWFVSIAQVICGIYNSNMNKRLRREKNEKCC